MMKCDFCEKYQMNKQKMNGEFICRASFPEDYCKRAIERMTSSMKAIGNIETRKTEAVETYVKNDQDSLGALIKSLYESAR